MPFWQVRIVSDPNDGGQMTDATRAVVVGPNDGTRIEGPVGGPLTFKVRGEQTNGILAALENVVTPGRPPLHTHANEDESWYVIEGELRFKLAGDVQCAPAGSFVFVPRGTPHCFQNVADAPAERFFDGFAARGRGCPLPSELAPGPRDAGRSLA
jgi:oxalate decarboxylase/phosphoglucose isomerase-like protein (cupin superfamily)